MKTAKSDKLLSPTVRLTYAPQGATLRAFHQSTAFIRDLIGPLGSGKTQACIFELLRCIDNQSVGKVGGALAGIRASRWLVVRNTYRDLQTTTIKDWRQFTDPLSIGAFSNGSNGEPPHWRCEYRKPDGTIVQAEVSFEAFDHSLDEKKARGKQLTGVWFNERKELNKQNVDMLHGRVTRYPRRVDVPNAKFHIIGDSNAPDRDHWLAKLALEVKPENWWFGIQPGGVLKDGGRWVINRKAENLNNLHPRYYLDQVAGKKESWVRKNLANEFVVHSDGRAVHPSFNEALHVGACEATPGIELYVGVDFGRTPAATIMQKQYDGQWYVLREIVTENMAAKEFGELLAERLAADFGHYVFNVIGDPAGDDMAQTRDETPLDMLNLSGLNAIPAPTNDFEERITALDVLLNQLIQGEPAILIDPSCSMVVRGLAGEYQMKRMQVAGEERYRDKPDKGPTSHVVESLHYGLLGAGVGNELYTAMASPISQRTDRPIDTARYFE